VTHSAHCPTCGFVNNGFLRADFPRTHRLFGYLVRCPDCQNVDALVEKLARKSQLTGWLVNAKFDTFRRAASNGNALDACKALATGDRVGWLVVHGSYGCGKTHLLAATVNDALRRHLPAVYFTLADLVHQLRRATLAEGNELDELLRQLSQVQLLAIDEFDASKVKLTDFVLEKLYVVCDDRYRQVGARSTLFACQDKPDIYPASDPASLLNYVHSRMADGRNQVIAITSGDYRRTVNA
jgi:DNA replication protein DnaC